MPTDLDTSATVTRVPFSTRQAAGGSLACTYVRLVYSESLAPGAPRLGEITAFVAGDRRTLTVGRSPGVVRGESALALPFDHSASRRHAHIERAPDEGLLVRDLGSRNGTFVDGVAARDGTVALPGSVIRVGGTLFVVGEDDLLARRALVDEHPPPSWMHVWSGPSTALWAALTRLAGSDVPVLLSGEMGTGKTRLAETLHRLGPRARAPFVAFNCSAIPHRLEEATLFGVAPGFIPTVKERQGWIARARDGTLFLDELGDMPGLAQAKLLDAFDTREPGYIPVGGTSKQRTRCRLVSATNRDVFGLARAGTLRQDLLSRLVTGHVRVPPLRERREELLALYASLRAAAPGGAGGGGGGGALVEHVEVAEAMLLAGWTENIRGLESWAARMALGESPTPAAVREHADRGAGGHEPTSAGVATPAPAPAPAGLGLPRGASGEEWPPTRLRLLQMLAESGWRVAAVGRAVGRRRETVSRRVTVEFGPGGRATARKVWAVCCASGRVPSNEQVELLHRVWIEAPDLPGAAEARAAWSERGVAEAPPAEG